MESNLASHIKNLKIEQGIKEKIIGELEKASSGVQTEEIKRLKSENGAYQTKISKLETEMENLKQRTMALQTKVDSIQVQQKREPVVFESMDKLNIKGDKSTEKTYDLCICYSTEFGKPAAEHILSDMKKLGKKYVNLAVIPCPKKDEIGSYYKGKAAPKDEAEKKKRYKEGTTCDFIFDPDEVE